MSLVESRSFRKIRTLSTRGHCNGIFDAVSCPRPLGLEGEHQPAFSPSPYSRRGKSSGIGTQSPKAADSASVTATSASSTCNILAS